MNMRNMQCMKRTKENEAVLKTLLAECPTDVS